MKRTRKPDASGDMRPEYRFDYSQSRPNRYAGQMEGDIVAVVLEPDVAAVFNSSAAVNRFLRSVISAVPKAKPKPAPRRTRRNAS